MMSIFTWLLCIYYLYNDVTWRYLSNIGAMLGFVVSKDISTSFLLIAIFIDINESFNVHVNALDNIHITSTISKILWSLWEIWKKEQMRELSWYNKVLCVYIVVLMMSLKYRMMSERWMMNLSNKEMAEENQEDKQNKEEACLHNMRKKTKKICLHNLWLLELGYLRCRVRYSYDSTFGSTHGLVFFVNIKIIQSPN